ncbi:MAG: hypothetical protein Q9217_000357 [Psora testacea]
MAKKSKLLAALDAHRGRDHKLEKQRKLRKQAEKRKRSGAGQANLEEENGNIKVATNGTRIMVGVDTVGRKIGEGEASSRIEIETFDPMEDDSNRDSNLRCNASTSTPAAMGAVNSNSDLEEDNVREGDNGDGIALSDVASLASSEKADILLHQRLTINNTTALLKAHKSITLPYDSLPFSAHQTFTTHTPILIPDVNDDLSRELAFYKQSLQAANEGRTLLKKEGIPFSRPNDYFAEMIKSDEQMDKIKQKMVDEAANKKAASEARRQRDLKRFGKQVQVAKEQERAKAKRDTLDKINLLKRKRKNTVTSNANEEDLFEVALEDAAKEDGQSRSVRKGAEAKGPNKRRRKDEKFGFGGKKRFSKSGDALSTGDMSGFSAKKMKGKKGVTRRFGKSRRAKDS